MSFEVCAVVGRLVGLLMDGTHAPATYDLSWQLPVGERRPAPGVYYMRLESNDESESRQSILPGP